MDEKPAPTPVLRGPGTPGEENSASSAPGRLTTLHNGPRISFSEPRQLLAAYLPPAVDFATYKSKARESQAISRSVSSTIDPVTESVAPRDDGEPAMIALGQMTDPFEQPPSLPDKKLADSEVNELRNYVSSFDETRTRRQGRVDKG